MSDNKTKRIAGLIDEQEQLLLSLKKEIDDIDADKITAENEELKKAVEKASAENTALKIDNEKLSKQLEVTKSSLYAKMANEKLSVFLKTQKELDHIYYTENSALENRLEKYRKNCKANVELMRKKLEGVSDSEYNDLRSRLNMLDAEIDQKLMELKTKLDTESSAMIDANNQAGAQLRNEGLTEREKKVSARQKNIESFIGLNILSKAGILLFIIGIIALGRFAYINLPTMFKGLLIYALGGVLLGVGGLFHKKEKNVLSTTLISGGVAVLYAATVTSYFVLDLFSVKIAFLVCVIITALAILLSVQLKNQVVSAFAAVGGYLPLVAVYMIGFGSAAADKTFLPVSAVYFFMLSVVVFVMTCSKRWYVSQYIGYGLHLLAIVGISRCAWVLRDSAGYGYALPLAAGFAIVSFVVYMLLPSVRLIKFKEVTTSHTVLMGLNTISGMVSIGVTLNNCFASDETGSRAVGIVFLVLAVLYVLLIKMSGRIELDYKVKAMRSVLYSGLLALTLFASPLIFGWSFIGIAWTIEGAMIAVIANSKQQRVFELVGFISMLLSVPVFAVTAIISGFSAYDPIVIITLTVMFAGFWSYLVFAVQKSKSVVYTVLEVIMSVVSVPYLCYVYKFILALPFVKYYSGFTDIAIFALVLALVSSVMHAKLLKNKISDIVSLVMRCIMALTVLSFADIVMPYQEITLYYGAIASVKSIMIINIVLLAVVNILSVVLLSLSLVDLMKTYAMPSWVYTAVTSVSALALITAVLMGQFNIAFSNVLISALYIAAAVVLLFIGFRKRYTIVRTGGLVLVLTAFAKLCFVDTHALNTGWKIGAYFAFGAVLIIISFFYQRFNKKLEQESVNYLDSKGEE